MSRFRTLFRPSLVVWLNYSLSESLQNRKLKTNLPVSDIYLLPKISIKLYENMRINQFNHKKYYNKNCSKKEKSFKKGVSVLWLKNNVWEVGVIIGEANTPRF